MVMSSMSGESCRHMERLKLVGVVICNPGVIVVMVIGCGSSHRFHIKCIYIQRKAAKSNPPEAHKVTIWNLCHSQVHMLNLNV